MHIVFLLHQSSDGASHGDDIIVRMRREHYHSLWIRFCALRTGTVVDIGFSSRPSRDGVLQFVKHLDVHQTSLSVKLFHEMSQTILHIVLCREFQQRFLHLSAQFNHLTPQLMIRHRNVSC